MLQREITVSQFIKDRSIS